MLHSRAVERSSFLVENSFALVRADGLGSRESVALEHLFDLLLSRGSCGVRHTGVAVSVPCLAPVLVIRGQGDHDVPRPCASDGLTCVATRDRLLF
jgi:hypothetical protein